MLDFLVKSNVAKRPPGPKSNAFLHNRPHPHRESRQERRESRSDAIDESKRRFTESLDRRGEARLPDRQPIYTACTPYPQLLTVTGKWTRWPTPHAGPIRRRERLEQRGNKGARGLYPMPALATTRKLLSPSGLHGLRRAPVRSWGQCPEKSDHLTPLHLIGLIEAARFGRFAEGVEHLWGWVISQQTVERLLQHWL